MNSSQNKKYVYLLRLILNSLREETFHCTPVGLTFSLALNVGDSGAQLINVEPRFELTPIN